MLDGTFSHGITGRAQTSFGEPLILAEQFSLDGPDAPSSFAAGTFILKSQDSAPLYGVGGGACGDL